MTAHNAEKVTGLATAVFFRIRQARLNNFTINRLMNILDQLNRHMQVQVFVSVRQIV